MKKIFILSIIILTIFLSGIFNCQQAGSSGGGGGSSDDGESSLRVYRVAAGGYHNAVIFNNGTVKCWGLNSSGQLGYGDTNDRGDNPGEMGGNLPTVNLGTGLISTHIAAGNGHTVVRFSTGEVKCWGDNGSGRLGYGDAEDRGDEPGEMGDNLQPVELGTGRYAVQVAAGAAHTVVILNDGSVKCWGQNNYGQLGIESNLSIGDDPGEMVDDDSYDAILTGGPVKQVAAGLYHTVALFYSGTVKCWGNNSNGQLGYGDTEDRGDEPGEMGAALLTVDLGAGRTAEQIAAGGNFTVALLDNGALKCWGQNNYGQLGYGDTEDRGDEPGEMGNSLPIVNLGTGRYAIQVNAGLSHTLTLLNADGLVKCWGTNSNGQLGYGDMEYRGDEAGEMGNNLPLVDVGIITPLRHIAGGNYHTILVFGDGRVKCWGDNNRGQLGYGDNVYRGDGPGEMGTNLPFVSLW